MFAKNPRFTAFLLTLITLTFLVACGEDGADNGIDECMAYPTCGTNEEEVDECPSGASCYESSICGQTILCQENDLDCDLSEHCPDARQEVESCDDLEDCITHHTCGGVIYCNSTDTCAALPTCPGGSVEVDECSDDGVCTDVTECDMTITCEETDDCTATPACPDGSEEVDECSTDGVCTDVTECDETIICEETPDSCTAVPTCEPGDDELTDGDCPAGATCYDVEECDLEITCIESEDDVCDDTFSCPDTFSLSADYPSCTGDEIEDNSPICLTVEICGDEIFCQSDGEFDCSSTFDLCPAGFEPVADCDLGDDTCIFSVACDDSSWCEAI